MSGPGRFEDILEGYFPLRFSIEDMMRRRGQSDAVLEMSFAPIIEVEGLPHDAPVPLNIRSGRAGIIDYAKLLVSVRLSETRVTGQASWRWLDGAPAGAFLDPMLRLAEPALVTVCPVAEALSISSGILTSG